MLAAATLSHLSASSSFVFPSSFWFSFSLWGFIVFIFASGFYSICICFRILCFPICFRVVYFYSFIVFIFSLGFYSFCICLRVLQLYSFCICFVILQFSYLLQGFLFLQFYSFHIFFRIFKVFVFFSGLKQLYSFSIFLFVQGFIVFVIASSIYSHNLCFRALQSTSSLQGFHIIFQDFLLSNLPQ